MKVTTLLLCVALAGCAGNLRLLEEGKSHAGTWNAASKAIEVDIDGRKYAGTFSQAVTVSFGQASTYGARPIFATGTAIGSNGSGQAVLTSVDGKVIQCQFQAQMGRGHGQCEGMDGRRYALIIGG